MSGSGFRDLPSDLVRKVVSFSSAKASAFHKTLAFEYRNLFDIIPSLQFTNIHGDAEGDDFVEFVARISLLDATTRINEVVIEYDVPSDVCQDHLNRLGSFLDEVARRGITKLRIRIKADSNTFPCEIFNAKTMRNLEIGENLRVTSLPQNASFPMLDSLKLHSVQFDTPPGQTCVFKKLFSACPVLDSLDIHDVKWGLWKWGGEIASPSLSVLWIVNTDTALANDDHTRLVFNTPKLELLYYRDYVPHSYGVVHLESLIIAQLSLHLRMNQAFDATRLIQGLSNVTTLKLWSADTLTVFSLFRHAIPMFPNLTELEVNPGNGQECWDFFPALMDKSPKVKIFSLTGYLHQAGCQCLKGYSFLRNSNLEEVYLQIYDRNCLSGISHFLKKCSCLRLMEITSEIEEGKERNRMVRDLKRMYKKSDGCIVRFGAATI
ncbi:hypothetical protein CARUB_v10000998mg [Capsella rubella]|uniref:F-box/LRR-repeat protein 15/At3g58940/PEG3-like LRR domain-containing protein n=1 Tax=Capsella rubella TaxID=81985 RepID=R0FFG9_9BRAS|nr:F-box/LRR-repeat protein At3g58980 [Capsella rubella]EOA20681.1 hypothetical protein CARUB_v10000998mg [Capsella rubella]